MGCATVIIDTEHYKTMANTILNDANHRQIPKNMDKIEYNQFLNQYNTCLTERELYYLQVFDVRSSNIYGLPKVHKSEQIWTNVKLPHIHTGM